MCTPFKRVETKKGLYTLSEPASAEEIIYMARCLVRRRFRRGITIKSPKATRDYFTTQFGHYEHEVFAVLFMDNRHRIIAMEEMFQGTIDGASVHPREVVKRALYHNAAAVIFAHNHPSGVAEPSQADRGITRRLQDSLALVDVRVLDHFIIGDEEVVSFAERGLI